MSSLEMPPPPWIVGHRGAAGEACENTLRALRLGAESGASMLELDVQLAADGVLVCFHDWDLERLANRAEIIEELASGRLIDIPLGAGADSIPTFAAALAALPDSMPLNVELKRRQAPAGDLAARLLEELDGRRQVLVSSFDWGLLAVLRARASELPLAPLSRSRERRALAVDPAGDLIGIGQALGAFSLHCSRSMVEPGFVERAADAGFERLLAYTVNDLQEAATLFDGGFSGVFTDVPSAMVAHFRPDRWAASAGEDREKLR